MHRPKPPYSATVCGLPAVRFLLLTLVCGGAALKGATINGFNIDERSVPATHLVRAAPAKDSIQAVMTPVFIAPSECTWLADEDEVLSVTVGDETRAYPLRLLVWHEIVNDQIGDVPVVVTYSALSGSGVAFAPGRRADGTSRTFGVSGILYNSCLLMYDHETESLWSQLGMACLAGAKNGEALEMLPTRRLTWGLWKQVFPAGRVMSRQTGIEADYESAWPYGDYAEDRSTIFPFDINRNEFGTKERVIGYNDGESQRCWPLEKLKVKGQMYDAIGSRTLKVFYDEETGEVQVQDMRTREVLPVVSAYWFAWQAFHPDTTVWIPLN